MKLNLDILMALAQSATPGPWRQGKTLLTAQTRLWSEEEIVRNDAIEATMVFADFNENDEGRGRRLVAKSDEYCNSAYIAACSPDVIISLIKRCQIAERLVGDVLSETGKATVTDACSYIQLLREGCQMSETALRSIASCTPHHPGDVVSVARTAVKEIDKLKLYL